jgi:AcrR family transcriptional regulator
MELFQERGYARTTVEEIAARAGLTERTFFRYFSDKREVLFSGSRQLEDSLRETIAQAPKERAPLELVVDAFAAAGASLQALRELSYVRARRALLVEHAELRERELIKLASLAAVVTHALHARGVREPAASMAAEVGLAAFKVGFERWVSGKRPHDFAAHVRAAMVALEDARVRP